MTPDFFLREMESVGELVADAEGALRPGPDGDASVLPLGDGGARLERGVRDVFDGVGLREFVRGLRDAVIDGAGHFSAARVFAGFELF